jgi:hypothetical protein
MAETAYTHSQDKLYISTTTQNADLDDHATTGFPGLTYTEVKGIGSFGETGTSTNVVSYDQWGSLVVSKGKGMTDAGDPEVEMLEIAADPGQVAMAAAGAPSVKDNYAFKHTRQDGSTRYYRGLVMGPRYPGGRNEDITLLLYTIALNQLPLNVAA